MLKPVSATVKRGTELKLVAESLGIANTYLSEDV
jgi:hypothetical protein